MRSVFRRCWRLVKVYNAEDLTVDDQKRIMEKGQNMMHVENRIL